MRHRVGIGGLIGAGLLLGGCATGEPDWVQYQCEGLPVKARLSAEMVEIESPLFSGSLPAVPAASGVKYQQDDKLFWTHAAEDALAEFDGKRRLCLTDGEGLYSYSLF